MSQPVIGSRKPPAQIPEHPPEHDGAPVYELYFVGRLLEELALADNSEDAGERAIHLQACRYYRDLLTSPQTGDDDAPAAEERAAKP